MHLIIVQVMALLVAITIHEFAHGWAADKAGDPTARLMGRLTFNPIAHIDLFGTVILPALLILSNAPFLVGWAKPVPVNPLKFRRIKRDFALVSAAGPLSNLAVAFLAGVALRVVYYTASATGTTSLATGEGGVLVPLFWFFRSLLEINVVLAVFNMMPIPPLDGGHFLQGILPDGPADILHKMEPYGMLIILGLFYFGFFDLIIFPVSRLIIAVLLF